IGRRSSSSSREQKDRETEGRRDGGTERRRDREIIAVLLLESSLCPSFSLSLCLSVSPSFRPSVFKVGSDGRRVSLLSCAPPRHWRRGGRIVSDCPSIRRGKFSRHCSCPFD